MTEVAVMSKTQESFNNKLSALRARIENPFAWIKNRFLALAEPWAESEEQRDAAVMYAMAVYTLDKRKI